MNSGDTDDAPKWVQETGCISSNPSDDYKATFTRCEKHILRLPDEFYLEVVVNTQNYFLHEHTFKVQWRINDLRPGSNMPFGPVAEGYAWTVEKAKAMAVAMVDALRLLPTIQEDLDALDAQQPRPPLPPIRGKSLFFPIGGTP